MARLSVRLTWTIPIGELVNLKGEIGARKMSVFAWSGGREADPEAQRAGGERSLRVGGGASLGRTTGSSSERAG